ELFQERTQEQERIAVFAAHVLAVDEHARIRAQGVADAHHDAVEEGAALRVAWRIWLERRQRRIVVHAATHDRIEDLDVRAAFVAGEYSLPNAVRLGPWRIDPGACLLLDEGVGRALEPIEIPGSDHAVRFEASRVRG